MNATMNVTMTRNRRRQAADEQTSAQMLAELASLRDLTLTEPSLGKVARLGFNEYNGKQPKAE